MKVLFYTSLLTRSGAGLFFAVSGLAKALAAQGVDITVVGGADQHFEDDRTAWGGAKLQPHASSARRYGLDLDALGSLRNLKPDVVHVHGIWSATSIYGRAAELAGCPTIVSPHGMLAPLVLARRAAVKRTHAFLFEKPLLRRAHVHVLNENERRQIAAFLPSAEERTFVVPNGVPDLAVRPPPVARSGTLFLGRLHPVKQVAQLIAAWRALGLPPEERLTIAGWGDPEYEAEIRRVAAGAANIEVVGPLHGEAKDAALASTRFFILPSLGEGFPMAVLEAVQHGAIPILTPECNLPELFEQDIALPLRSDFSDFPAAMSHALALSAPELERRSAAATAYADRYAWSSIADSMIGHYRGIIDDAVNA